MDAEDLEALRRQLDEKVRAHLAAGGKLSDPEVVELSQRLDQLVARGADGPAADAVFSMVERSD